MSIHKLIKRHEFHQFTRIKLVIISAISVKNILIINFVDGH